MPRVYFCVLFSREYSVSLLFDRNLPASCTDMALRIGSIQREDLYAKFSVRSKCAHHSFHPLRLEALEGRLLPAVIAGARSMLLPLCPGFRDVCGSPISTAEVPTKDGRCHRSFRSLSTVTQTAELAESISVASVGDVATPKFGSRISTEVLKGPLVVISFSLSVCPPSRQLYRQFSLLKYGHLHFDRNFRPCFISRRDGFAEHENSGGRPMGSSRHFFVRGRQGMGAFMPRHRPLRCENDV